MKRYTNIYLILIFALLDAWYLTRRKYSSKRSSEKLWVLTSVFLTNCPGSPLLLVHRCKFQREFRVSLEANSYHNSKLRFGNISLRVQPLLRYDKFCKKISFCFQFEIFTSSPKMCKKYQIYVNICKVFLFTPLILFTPWTNAEF